MNTKNRFISLLAQGLRIVLVSLMALSFLISTPARAAELPNLTVDMILTGGNLIPLETGRTYTITVSNIGDDPTTAPAEVVFSHTAGLTVTAISGGTDWSCTLGTLTCTNSNSLASQESYPVITVTVSVLVGAPPEITSQAVVSGGGSDDDPDNNTDSVISTVEAKADLVITGYELLNADKTAVITQPTADEIFWIRMTVENQGGAGSGNFYPGVFLDEKPNYGPDHDEPPLLNLGDVTDFQGYKMTPSGAVSGPGCLYYDPTNSINPMTTSVYVERGNYTRLDILPSLPAGTDTTVDVQIAYPAGQYLNSIYDTDDVRTGLKPGTYQIYLYADPNCSAGSEEAQENNNSYGPIEITIESTYACAYSGPQIFTDVPPSHWANDYIEAMYNCGYTAGCSSSPLKYCPDSKMTRVESSVFMLRGNFGSTYTPPAPPYGTFADDWTIGTWGEKWAEGLFDAGLTAGCGTSPLKFCPWDQTPRVQLAVFGVRLRHGSSFVPPPATGTVFADLTNVSYFGTKWAEQAYADGLIPACGTQGGKPMFCPEDLVDRALAAYTVAKAKYLVP